LRLFRLTMTRKPWVIRDHISGYWPKCLISLGYCLSDSDGTISALSLVMSETAKSALALKAVPIAESAGMQWDLVNASGYAVGWVGRMGDERKLFLMSTGAPLTDAERAVLARAASRALSEKVWA
jgi:hypothetical protein